MATWDEQIAASGSTLDPGADFGQSWDGSFSGGLSTISDPLDRFQTIANTAVSAINAYMGLKQASDSLSAARLNRDTQAYIAQRNADTQKSMADVQLAAAQRGMNKGDNSQLMTWLTIIGVVVAVIGLARAKK